MNRRVSRRPQLNDEIQAENSFQFEFCLREFNERECGNTALRLRRILKLISRSVDLILKHGRPISFGPEG